MQCKLHAARPVTWSRGIQIAFSKFRYRLTRGARNVYDLPLTWHLPLRCRWPCRKHLLNDLEKEKKEAHRHSVFLAYGALLHSGLFLVATLWIAIPILLIDSCDFLGST